MVGKVRFFGKEHGRGQEENEFLSKKGKINLYYPLSSPMYTFLHNSSVNRKI
jgi:hypothetical protein